MTEQRFPGFWTDTDKALALLDGHLAAQSVTEEEAGWLRDFIVKGYAVIPGAISHEQADALLADMESVSQCPEHYIARRERQAYTHPTPDVVEDTTFRLIDFHANSVVARDVQFAPKIQRMLELVFEAPPLAFQSLTFNYGSQQGIHQDGAYVVVDQPLKFAASWVALEDVTKGSGELIYFPGSHKLEHYLFSGEHKSWKPARDGEEAGKVYIKSLWDRIRERGIPQEHFLPKKGDALIWAADLVHGGAKIHNGNSRRSFVTHYCPRGVSPQYKEFFADYFEREHRSNAFYSSRHYNLKPPSLVKSLFASELLKPAFMGSPREQRLVPQ